NFCSAAHQGHQVLWLKTHLLHAKLDRIDWIRREYWMVLLLIQFNKSGQEFEFVSISRGATTTHEALNLSHPRLVLNVCFDQSFDLSHRVFSAGMGRDRGADLSRKRE